MRNLLKFLTVLHNLEQDHSFDMFLDRFLFNNNRFANSSFSAFLPSSFCMYTTLIAMTGWFQDSTPLAILGVAAGAIMGWPFSVLIGYGFKLKGMFENVFSREEIVPLNVS